MTGIEHEARIDGIIAGAGGIVLQLTLGAITPDEIAELYRIKGLPVDVRIRRCEGDSEAKVD